MATTVRKIQEADIESFRLALGSVISERVYLQTQETPSQKDIAEFIKTNIAKDSAQYVAVVEDTVVGWADIIPYQKAPLKHVGLLGMGVILDHRGKGIGSELLTQTIKHAKHRGLKRIELEVYADNTAAIALYKKLGFELEGTKLHARYHSNRYHDVCFMALCFI